MPSSPSASSTTAPAATHLFLPFASTAFLLYYFVLQWDCSASFRPRRITRLLCILYLATCKIEINGYNRFTAVEWKWRTAIATQWRHRRRMVTMRLTELRLFGLVRYSWSFFSLEFVCIAISSATFLHCLDLILLLTTLALKFSLIWRSKELYCWKYVHHQYRPDGNSW